MESGGDLKGREWQGKKQELRPHLLLLLEICFLTRNEKVRYPDFAQMLSW